MAYVLYGIFFLTCIVLVAVVLLQPGKTDAGALFTSNISSNAFGPRGTASVLSKTTIVAAIVFLTVAFLLSHPALTGNVSVLQSAAETPSEAPAEQPAVAPDVNANASAPASDSNANGALIETPATNQFTQQAANAAASTANNAVNANAAKGASNANKSAANK